MNLLHVGRDMLHEHQSPLAGDAPLGASTLLPAIAHATKQVPPVGTQAPVAAVAGGRKGLGATVHQCEAVPIRNDSINYLGVDVGGGNDRCRVVGQRPRETQQLLLLDTGADADGVDLTGKQAALQAQRLFLTNEFHPCLEPDGLAVRDGGAGLQGKILGGIVGGVGAQERDQDPQTAG